MRYKIVSILLLFIFLCFSPIACYTIEPLVKNKYNLTEDLDTEAIQPIENIAILVDLKRWEGKDIYSKKTSADKKQEQDVAEVAFKGAIKKVLNLKGYECAYVDGNLEKAYQQADGEGCQALLYAKIKWAKGRIYYDEQYFGNYTKIRYLEDVPMARGSFNVVDVRNRKSIFKMLYEGHSNVSGNGPAALPRFSSSFQGEKEIPYIYRVVEDSLKEFPTIDKFYR